MEVEPQCDPFLQIVLTEGIDPDELLLCHGTEGIHDGEAVRPEPVDLFQQTEKLPVLIAHDIDRVYKERISFLHHSSAERHPLLHIIVMEGDSHGGDRPVILLQFPDVILVMERHDHKSCPSVFLREDLLQFTD